MTSLAKSFSTKVRCRQSDCWTSSHGTKFFQQGVCQHKKINEYFFNVLQRIGTKRNLMFCENSNEFVERMDAANLFFLRKKNWSRVLNQICDKRLFKFRSFIIQTFIWPFGLFKELQKASTLRSIAFKNTTRTFRKFKWVG